MPLIDDEVAEQLEEQLTVLENEVNLAFFTQEFECESCQTARQFLEEFSKLSNKINLEIYDLKEDSDKAEEYNVDKIPAAVLLDKEKKYSGLRFFGIPAGYEINSFVNALKLVSGGESELDDEIKDTAAKVEKDVHFQVFVTLQCPYCPKAVEATQQLAYENDNITADMLDSSIFNHLAVKYDVSGVPKTIVNETEELVGAQPPEEFLNAIKNL
ncbi:protein disulfide oxidoreductase [Halanaerobacter jeridensis]|uniref:Glutaredoxin-like protein n=1 Tax=Halanaerobacter jeridensis TaxID=706427 RepID=A0A939BT57_9FIRM|nr:thioredoxin family protein [Halanaerobacter jeridensis]MBM7557886.1 glutaredoxin-like protein [Halanaerobacter jeridensis]